MKYSRSVTHRRLHTIPALRFETQTLTSCSGLVLVQALCGRLRLKERLRACFDHLAGQPIFGPHVVVLLLVVHLVLGYRELRDSRYYRDDPLVLRVLGLRRLPDVATISRALAHADARSVAKLRALSRQLVLERLQELRPARLTGVEFKVIVTNKVVGPATVLAFHNGRGAQETLFGQLKSQCQVDYVPMRRLIANQIFLLAGLLTHNLGREWQMTIAPPARATTPKRTPFWMFHELQTLRRTLLLRAGRLTRPNGELTLTVSAKQAVREKLQRHLAALSVAA